MKTLTLAVCLGLFALGCGSGSMVNTANNVVMKGGQWEYVVTPTNGAAVMNFEANVPGTNVQFNGSSGSIFYPSEVPPTSSTTPQLCGPLFVSGEINGDMVKGDFDLGDATKHFASFSGVLAANGQSLTSGSYNGQTCVIGDNASFKGSFTGQTIAPVNGTYMGTLTSSAFGADVVTLTITQNADFSLNIAGTSVENGVTTVFASPATALPGGSPAAAVTGAMVGWGGTATNVNESQNFSFRGHLNAAATQLSVTLFQVGPTETVSGTLTKQ
jgi:hypothetical protein